MDIAQFLLAASNSTWPHLRHLDLEGYLDRDVDGDVIESKQKACSGVLEGLAVALPSMRKLTRVDIVQTHNGYSRNFLFCMDLTPRWDTEWHGYGPVTPFHWSNNFPIYPCGSLPTPVCATVKAYHMILQGPLVTELQNTVWKHRRLELAVWQCEGSPKWGCHNGATSWGICTIWNRMTDTWNPARMNDIDIFIYEMGEYWSQVNSEW